MIFGILFFLSFFLLPCQGKPQVCIDPGHGGLNTGAQVTLPSRTYFEKDITLNIAKKLKTALEQKGIASFLTRNTDEDVSLLRRTAIATQHKADLTLSIHLNNSHLASLESQGIETYLVDTSQFSTFQSIARLPDLKGPETMIHDLLMINALTKSKHIAHLVQNSLVKHISYARKIDPKKINRGIKNGSFDILLRSTIPSILIEAGFLSHPHERYFLISENGATITAKAISEAVEKYYQNTSF